VLLGHKNILLDDPEALNIEVGLAMMTALYKYMTPQEHKPSAHDVIVGWWQANDADKIEKIEKGFGVTVNIYSDGSECKSDTTNSSNRGKCFKYFMDKFNRPAPLDDEVSCKLQNKFTSKGSAAKNIYWTSNPAKNHECKLVDRRTGFPIWLQDSYERCLEHYSNSTATGSTTGTTNSIIYFGILDVLEEECLQNTPEILLGNDVDFDTATYSAPEFSEI
jgi:hypothetical protein